MWKSIILACVVLCPFIVSSAPCEGCGDYKEMDEGDENVEKIIHDIFVLFSKFQFGHTHWKLVDVFSAEEAKCLDEEECGKAAAYRIKISTVPTTCAKKDFSYEDAQDCDALEGAEIHYCTLIEKRNKNGKYVLQRSSCSKKSS
ncbi:uncharacterized protein [Parasteatoda tepidariorum]|uniref:uncharacterized protein n=1 Tax=Parasteatoda tepidariorum TaxID=114398 RepID=UPI001C71FF05|nr:uncharacterized protein LOC107446904 [Parasteatoda tepidariorum]